TFIAELSQLTPQWSRDGISAAHEILFCFGFNGGLLQLIYNPRPVEEPVFSAKPYHKTFRHCVTAPPRSPRANRARGESGFIPLRLTRRAPFSPAAHEGSFCVRRRSETLVPPEHPSTREEPKSRPATMRTRARRHSSQKCPTGIDRCQRGSLEALLYPQAVKC